MKYYQGQFLNLDRDQYSLRHATFADLFLKALLNNKDPGSFYLYPEGRKSQRQEYFRICAQKDSLL